MSELSEYLSTIPTISTKHMEQAEREAGIQTMLNDLFHLADRDGCIAAAWALEIIAELYRKLESAECRRGIPCPKCNAATVLK